MGNESRLFAAVEKAQSKRWEGNGDETEELFAPVYFCEWCKVELEKRSASDLCRSCELVHEQSESA